MAEISNYLNTEIVLLKLSITRTTHDSKMMRLLTVARKQFFGWKLWCSARNGKICGIKEECCLDTNNFCMSSSQLLAPRLPTIPLSISSHRGKHMKVRKSTCNSHSNYKILINNLFLEKKRKGWRSMEWKPNTMNYKNSVFFFFLMSSIRTKSIVIRGPLTQSGAYLWVRLKLFFNPLWESGKRQTFRHSLPITQNSVFSCVLLCEPHFQRWEHHGFRSCIYIQNFPCNEGQGRIPTQCFLRALSSWPRLQKPVMLEKGSRLA